MRQNAVKLICTFEGMEKKEKCIQKWKAKMGQYESKQLKGGKYILGFVSDEWGGFQMQKQVYKLMNRER